MKWTNTRTRTVLNLLDNGLISKNKQIPSRKKKKSCLIWNCLGITHTRQYSKSNQNKQKWEQLHTKCLSSSQKINVVTLIDYLYSKVRCSSFRFLKIFMKQMRKTWKRTSILNRITVIFTWDLTVSLNKNKYHYWSCLEIVGHHFWINLISSFHK